MSGNCATGSRSTITAPAMTKKMAITIATIGWLMKNLDIALALTAWSYRCRGRRCGGRSHGSHLHPIAHLLQSFGDDAFAGRDPRLDDSKAAHLLADDDCAHRHLVVRTHDRDLVLPLGLKNGVLRDEQCVMPDVGGCAD